MLGETSCGPRPGGDDERFSRHFFSAELAQSGLSLGVESRYAAAGLAGAEQERLPPVVEVRMLDINHDGALLDLVHTCRSEQLRKVPVAHAGQPRLVLGIRIELPRRLPEQTEGPWPPAA